MSDQPKPTEDSDGRRTSPRPAGKPERLWRELLGRQLRRLRRSRDETLESVAQRANVSLQYLSEVERGTKEPSSEVVAAICAALGTTLLDLTVAVADQLRADRATAPAAVRSGDFTLAA